MTPTFADQTGSYENALVARQTMTSHQALAILRETPDQLRRLTAGVSERTLDAAPKTDEWSVVEILGHLRACADVWGDAIGEIVRSDHPTITAVSPRTWIEQTDYRDLAFSASFKAFTTQRTKLLTLLGSLASPGWSRCATVLGAGRPLEWTVLAYADRMARHERAHWKQVGRTIEQLDETAASRR